MSNDKPNEGTGREVSTFVAPPPPQRGRMAADIIAIFLSLVWLGGVAAYFLVLKPQSSGTTQAGIVLTMLAVFLPIALIWIGATVAKTARLMREESARLQGVIDEMHHKYLVQAQTAASEVQPVVAEKLDALVESQKQTEAAMATFASTRELKPRETASVSVPMPAAPTASVAEPEDAEEDEQMQHSLALDTPEVAPVLSVSDFIGALNFPENEQDAQGFQQLRRALNDPNSGKLVRASQDVLTLLSQEGVYMDDLRPDRSRPVLWRKFADGERGLEISGIGGIHDRSALALTTGRMRSDPVFRDAVHHFLRQFDNTFAKFAEHATDDDIIRLADTRTARAFMLLGRAAGTFA